VGKQPDEEVLSWQDERLSNNGCSLQVKWTCSEEPMTSRFFSTEQRKHFE
jgi:hypothetical protein